MLAFLLDGVRRGAALVLEYVSGNSGAGSLCFPVPSPPVAFEGVHSLHQMVAKGGESWVASGDHFEIADLARKKL